MNDIKKDIKFRQKCGVYGVNWECAEIYDNVILLNTNTLGLYILMDKNYNTFCIDVCDYSRFDSKEDFVRSKYYEYINATYEGENSKFYYPFNGFSLKNILDLSNCVLMMDDRDDNILCTIVNGVMYDRTIVGCDEYFQMLSYIKFLSEEVKRYFLMCFHIKSIGGDILNVYEYINLLISRIDEGIEFNIYNNMKPNILDICNCIGQNYRELKLSGILDDIVNLITNEKGYVIDNDFVLKKESSENIDLSSIAMDLLKILDSWNMDGVLENKKNTNIKKLRK